MRCNGLNKLCRFRRQLGQGMTEYIIIVAVIGIASIVIYTLYGDVLREQMATAGVALSGSDATAPQNSVSGVSNAITFTSGIGRDMQNFADDPSPHNQNAPQVGP